MTPKAVGGAEMCTMGGVLVIEELAMGALMQMCFPLNMLKNSVVAERWFEAAVAGEITVGVASSDPAGLAYLRDAVGTLIIESTADMHYSTVANILNMPGAEPGSP